MKYFKDNENNIFAFEDNDEPADYCAEALTQISEAEADEILNLKGAKMKKLTLEQIGEIVSHYENNQICDIERAGGRTVREFWRIDFPELRAAIKFEHWIGGQTPLIMGLQLFLKARVDGKGIAWSAELASRQPKEWSAKKLKERLAKLAQNAAKY